MAEASRVIELIFSAVDQASATVGEIGSGISEFGDRLGEAGHKADELAEPFAHLAELILGIVEAAQAAGAAVLAFSVKSAAEFDESFALISTKLKGGGEDLGAFKQSVLDAASTSSATFQDFTGSVQEVVQVLHDQAHAVELVQQAEELGDATGNNLKDTTKLLVLSLRDFGKGADDAAHFSDVLFTAARDGGGSFAELGETIGRIAPLAHQAGLTFEDTAAALTTMGRAGIDSGTASSALTRILSALADPTKEVQKAAARLGLDFSTTALQTKGFAGFLQDLTNKTGGNIDKLKELGISARGLNAVLALTAGGGQAFKESLDDITNSTGNTQRAYEVMAHQISQETQALENAIKGAAIQFGEPLVAAFLRVEQAAAKVFLAVGQAAKDGAFSELQKAANDALDLIARGLENLAKNLPAALGQLDFRPLIAQLEIAGEHLTHLFDGLDLSTPEGLAAALQKIINLGADLVAFHNGVVTALTSVFGPMVKLTGFIGGGGEAWAKYAGEVGGAAIAITLLSPALRVAGAALEILGGTLKLAVGTWNLLRDAVLATNLAMAANPVTLALLATAAAGAIIFHKQLGEAIVEVTKDLIGFGEGTAHAAEATDKHAQKLGLLAKPLSAAAAGTEDLSKANLKLVDQFDKLGLGLDTAAAKAREFDQRQAEIESSGIKLLLSLTQGGEGLEHFAVVLLHGSEQLLGLRDAGQRADETLEQFHGRLSPIVEQVNKVGGSAEDVTGAMGALIGAFEKADPAADALRAQIAALVGENQSLASAMPEATQAIDDAIEKLNLQAVSADATKGAIDAYLTAVREVGGVLPDATLASDLQTKGYKEQTIAVHDLETGTVSYTQALVFSGDAAQEAADKAALAMSKTFEETLKAEKQVSDIDLAWAKLDQEDRNLTFKLEADIAIAQIQQGTELVKAAFESINEGIKSTGDLLGELAKAFADVQSDAKASELERLLENEDKRRQQEFDLQKQLTDSQIAYLNAVTDRLNSGDATIQIDTTGVEPILKELMFSIMKQVQIQASSDAQLLLLGLQ